MALTERRAGSTDAELEAALARGREEAGRDGVRNVRYDAASDRIEISINDDATVMIARKAIPGLENATSKQLADVRLTPLRTSISFEQLDVDHAVQGLVRKVLGLNAQQRAAGSVTSAAKRLAAAANGAHGGRPRKEQAETVKTTEYGPTFYESIGAKGKRHKKSGPEFYESIGAARHKLDSVNDVTGGTAPKRTKTQAKR
jgi:hypothetical protein